MKLNLFSLNVETRLINCWLICLVWLVSMIVLIGIRSTHWRDYGACTLIVELAAFELELLWDSTHRVVEILLLLLWNIVICRLWNETYPWLWAHLTGSLHRRSILLIFLVSLTSIWRGSDDSHLFFASSIDNFFAFFFPFSRIHLHLGSHILRWLKLTVTPIRWWSNTIVIIKLKS